MSELIDRQAAIRATWQEPSYTDPLNVLTEVRDRINALPTITAPRWVRCEDAKPQNKTRCLLAIPTVVKSPDYKHYYEIGYYDGGLFTAYNSELGFIQLEPEWWMPIEPPKEDVDANK